MKQGKRERAMVFPDMKTTAGPCPVCVFAMPQTTCLGCRYNRAGRCQDRTVYGKDGGDLLTDDGPRVCYEKPQTLTEGLALYLLEHEGTKA